jgi:hypothetical protein
MQLLTLQQNLQVKSNDAARFESHSQTLQSAKLELEDMNSQLRTSLMDKTMEATAQLAAARQEAAAALASANEAAALQVEAAKANAAAAEEEIRSAARTAAFAAQEREQLLQAQLDMMQAR